MSSDVFGVEPLFNILRKLNPDFILVTGDTTSNHNLKHFNKLIKEFGKLDCNVYFIFGNHEIYIKNHILEKINEKFYPENIFILANNYSILSIHNINIIIYGLDNSYEEISYSCHDVFPNNITTNLKILLAHSPIYLKYVCIDKSKYDMFFFGHTHGNQISLPVINRLIRKKYRNYLPGTRKIGSKYICISKGIGTVKIPLRINCSPEITMYSVEF